MLMRTLPLLALAGAALLCLEAGTSPARADDLLCAATRDPASYKDKGYQMLIPGQEGFVFRSRVDLRDSFTVEDDVKAILPRIVQGFAKRGIALVVLLLPPRGLADARRLDPAVPEAAAYDPAKAAEGFNAYLAELRAAGLRVPAVLPTAPLPAGADFYHKRDQHITPTAAEIAARAVAAEVATIPGLTLPRTPSTMRIEGTIEIEETYVRAINKMCGSKVGEIELPRAVSSNEDGGDLLGGDDPQVVLVGTSQSRRDDNDSNLVGYLEAALGTRITNAAVSGGGLDAAMISYLASEEFAKQPPKLVIWEFPASSTINEPRELREIAAAINGVCTGPTLVREAKVTADGDSLTLFEGLPAEPAIAGQDFYLNVTGPAEALQKLQIQFQHAAGTENVKVQHSTRAPAAGSLFSMLDADDRGPLQGVALKFTDSVEGEFHARLCQAR